MTAPSVRGCWLGAVFDQWFARACNRDPAHRFSSASEQVEALAKSIGMPFDPRPETLRSNPGDSGSAHAEGSGVDHGGASLQAHAIGESSSNKAEVATIAQSGTLVSSSKEMPDVRVVSATKRRGGLVFAVISAAALLSILVVVFYRKDPGATPSSVPKVAAPLPAVAIAPEPGAPVVAPEPPHTAAIETLGPAKAPLPAAMASISAAKRREAPRPTPGKPAVSSGPARTDRALVNDPLGDQK